MSIENLITSATTRLDSAMSGAPTADPIKEPGKYAEQLFNQQMQMHLAQTANTATSEIIKAWGEGQKNIAKNMAI
jgi:hypothetical protein